MALLELDGVGRRRGGNWVLRDLSLAVDPGEFVAIWGARRSGRSTLLRLAAGLEAPDAGHVRLRGTALQAGQDTRGGSVAFVRQSFKTAEGALVGEQLIRAQLVRGLEPAAAQARVHRSLERAGAGRCAALTHSALGQPERLRVAIARALCAAPTLLVIDEPFLGVSLTERDGILELFRSLADEGTAVLLSASETTELQGSDRALWLRDGSLAGELTPRRAEVLELHPPQATPESASA
ncbi:MAG: ATP-binding cassette domain-containing protein [Solirubrobacteraceae bacterium]